MASEYGINIKIDPSGAVTGGRQAKRSLEEVDRAAQGVDRSVGNLPSKFKEFAAQAVTIGAVTAAVRTALKASTQFEKSLSDLSAITGATGKDLEYLKSQAADIGATTSLSASQAAEAFKLIASAKPDLLENAEALNEVTRSAVTLAEAAGITLPDAANTLGSALNQFQADAAETNRFINVLAAGAKFGSSEITETAEALKIAGVAANASGVTFEELNAAIQQLASVGIKGSEAGTALRNIILKLESDIDRKLNPTTGGLLQSLRELQSLQEGTAATTKRFGLENVVAAQVLRDGADAIGDLTQRVTGTNTALDQAATRTNNLQGDLDSLASATEAVAIAFGDKLNPAAREATQAMTAGLSALSREADTVVDVLGGVLVPLIAGRLVGAIAAKTQAITADIAATRAATAAELESARATQQSTAAETAQLRLQQQSLTQQLQLAQSERTRLTIRRQLAANSAALVAATSAEAAAVSRLDAAQKQASASARAFATARAALSGAVGLLGGPAGVITLAAVAAFQFYQRAEQAKQAALDYAEGADKLTLSLKDMTEAQKAATAARLEESQIALADEIETLRSRYNALTNNLQLLKAQTLGVVDVSEREAKTRREQAKLLEEIERRERQLSQAKSAGFATQQALIGNTRKEYVTRRDANEQLGIAIRLQNEFNRVAAVKPDATGAPSLITRPAPPPVPTTSAEGQAALEVLRRQAELSRVVGVERAKLAAVQRLGAGATAQEIAEAQRLAAEMYRLSEAQKTTSKTTRDLTQERQANADAVRAAQLELASSGIRSAEAYARMNGDFAEADRLGKQLAQTQAQLALNEYATPEQVANVRALAAAMYDLDAAQRTRSQFQGMQQQLENPIERLRRERKERLDVIREYEMLETADHQAAVAARAEIDRQFREQESEALIASFAQQSETNQLLVGQAQQLGDAFATNLTQAIFYGGTLGDVLRNTAATAVQSLINEVIKMGVQWVVTEGLKQTAINATTAATTAGAAASVAAATTSTAAATAGLATTTAASTASAAATTAAWTPAAIVSSIGSFGTAAAIGLAAVVAALAFSGFKKGGYTGDGGVNDVAGVVHGKEFVMNADATRRHRPVLEAMNSGRTITPTATAVKTEDRSPPVVNQTINVTGTVDRRTSSQIARDTARRQQIATARFGRV